MKYEFKFLHMYINDPYYLAAYLRFRNIFFRFGAVILVIASSTYNVLNGGQKTASCSKKKRLENKHVM